MICQQQTPVPPLLKALTNTNSPTPSTFPTFTHVLHHFYLKSLFLISWICKWQFPLKHQSISTMLYCIISQKTLPIPYQDNLISDHILHKSKVTTMVILNCQVTENGRVQLLLFHVRSNTYSLCCSRSATTVYLCCWLFMLMKLPECSINWVSVNAYDLIHLHTLWIPTYGYSEQWC